MAIFSHLNPSLGHLFTASYFFVIALNSLTALDPQEGHLSGKVYFYESLLLLVKSTDST